MVRLCEAINEVLGTCKKVAGPEGRWQGGDNALLFWLITSSAEKLFHQSDRSLSDYSWIRHMALASAPEIARRCKWHIPRVLTDKLVGVSLLRHFTHSSRVLGLVISIVDNKCDFVILICDVSWTPDVSSADSWRPRTCFAISSNDIPLINAVCRQYSIFWLLSYKTRKHAHQWRLLLLDINKKTRARSVPNNDTCHARVILADLNFFL